MVTKKLLIAFADPTIKVADHAQDLRYAVDEASVNLRARHKVVLHLPTVREYGSMEIQIDIPDEKADGFAYGVHLRGISSYLLKHCSYPYKEHKVGTRLLHYIELP